MSRCRRPDRRRSAPSASSGRRFRAPPLSSATSRSRGPAAGTPTSGRAGSCCATGWARRRVPAAVPVSSATSGLQVALAALRSRGPRRATDVLVPSFAFPAPAQAIVWNGLRPVFVDVVADHWHLDPDVARRRPGAAARRRRRRGRAVELRHAAAARRPRRVGGGLRRAPASRCWWTPPPGSARSPQTAARSARRARPRSSPFTPPSRWPRARAARCFTRDPELAEEIRRLGNFGFDADHEPLSANGTNAKLGEPACAIALAAFDALPAQLAARRERALPGSSTRFPASGRSAGTSTACGSSCP